MKGGPAAAEEAPLRVLLVEDDDRLARLTGRYLEQHQVVVTCVADGGAAVREALGGAFDVVLLDVMLPGKSGIEVCREIRAQVHVPIILVTARDEEADRVLGLESGADDYVTKPFSARELLARVRAQVRRARGQAGPPSRLLHAGRVAIDVAGVVATVDGQPLALTSYEFALLRALVERAGRVLTREQLLELASGNAEEAFDRSIDGHISRLRHKLGDDPRHPKILRTVRGVGYVLAAGDGE
jgi:DNA-binding response OmpR family regulator